MCFDVPAPLYRPDCEQSVSSEINNMEILARCSILSAHGKNGYFEAAVFLVGNYAATGNIIWAAMTVAVQVSSHYETCKLLL